MTLDNFPNAEPSITLDFTKSKKLDPRITFTRASAGTADSINFPTNVPRLSSQGLLIEESRTNHYPMFAQPGYNTDNNGVYSAYSDSTFGAAHNAHSWTFTTAVKQLIGQGNPGNITTPGDGVQYSVSFWAKANQAFELKTTIRDERRNNGVATFSLTTEWQYCTVTSPGGTDKGSGTTYLWLIDQVDVTAGLRIDFACVQMEVGGFATSYIPTDPAAPTTTVTRARDICEITGDEFSSWYNGIEGTIVSDVIVPSRECSYYSFTGTTYISTLSYVSPGTLAQSTGSQLSWTGTSYSDPVKVAVSYNDLEFVASRDGGTVQSDPSTVNKTGIDRVYFGRFWTGTNFAKGVTMSRLTYYPTRLSDEALQALTTPQT